MVGSWFGFLLLGRWMRRSGIPDSPFVRSNAALGRIVGSGAYALKSDATNPRECGAKGICARRNGRARREPESWPGRAAGEPARRVSADLRPGGAPSGRWRRTPTAPPRRAFRSAPGRRSAGRASSPCRRATSRRCAARRCTNSRPARRRRPAGAAVLLVGHRPRADDAAGHELARPRDMRDQRGEVERHVDAGVGTAEEPTVEVRGERQMHLAVAPRACRARRA